ncbi:MAG: ABC transporter ATP-binding protein [Myxococcota bacterium]
MALDFDEVHADRLVKVFGPTRALAGVSLRFAAGEVAVVEGPNGSGKSTLLSILGQLARPDAGTVRYGKHPPKRSKRQAIRRQIGILGHASMLYPDLTGRENLELFGALYGVPQVRRRVEALVERFEIGRFFERTTRNYSRGQLQRVALARAILHEPRLLLLDEPSTGLDVAGVRRLKDAVREEREAGRILVLVTHDEELAGAVADRRIRLARGKVDPVEGGLGAKGAPSTSPAGSPLLEANESEPVPGEAAPQEAASEEAASEEAAPEGAVPSENKEPGAPVGDDPERNDDGNSSATEVRE